MFFCVYAIKLRQQSAEYNFVQNPPFAAPAGFPIGFGVNRMANSLFPALAFHNTNKYLTRQHLQPFVLQQILQQQHLAKCKLTVYHINKLRFQRHIWYYASLVSCDILRVVRFEELCTWSLYYVCYVSPFLWNSGTTQKYVLRARVPTYGRCHCRY